MFDLLLLSALSLAGRAFAQTQPCAAVANAAAKFMAAAPQATSVYVPAGIAEACLASVPIDVEENKALIDELMLYLSWQSNIKYLLDPPAGYTEDRVDILDKFQEIYDRLGAGGYKDEYHFSYDLYAALTEAYDFHLYFVPDILNLFSFERANWDASELFALTSVSADGKALPELYNYFDIAKLNAGQTITASPIVQINNQSADAYVQNWAKMSTFHDKDARYNRLFPNQAGISRGSEVNEFIAGSIPDGPSTTVKHKNGTTFNYGNYARLLRDFTGIETGADVYNAFLNKGPPKTNQKREQKRATGTAVGYPQPVVLHSEAVVGGYYLSGPGYEDVAVLGIPSFGPQADGSAVEFQNVVAAFLKDAVASGKKKLVVDLRANGGGRVFLGYDLFKQLFPKVDPWGATRFRANDAFNAAGIAMTEALKGYTYEQAVSDAKSNTNGGGLALAWSSIFNYKLPLNTDGKNFKSWEDLFGPHLFNGDNFTSLERYDFNNIFGDDADMDVSGYGTRANALGAQPFEAGNIVMLQDGACGSTCAIFSELMKAQGGVRQIVMGGTPQNGPMQGVAGSKGAQVWNFREVYREAYNAYSFLSDYQVELNGTEVGQLVYAKRPLMRAAYSADGDIMAAINLRDNIRKGDDSQTPLEFVYEAADCRLWYTQQMITDPIPVWKATVDARWNNNKGCVDGSVGHKSSISGGVKLPIDTNGGGAKKNDGAGMTRSVMGMALAALASIMVVAF